MRKLGIFVLLLSIYIAFQFWDTFDPESIKGKNVVITGASTGIGEQLAYHYARLGANIVITARREKRLKEVVDKCRQEGLKDAKFYYIALDMGDKDATKKLIEFAESKLGGIDVLVLNHVMYNLMQKFLDMPDKLTYLRDNVDVNFHSYVSAATHAMPLLLKTNGSIVVMSSICGKAPTPFVAPYTAAKHALEGFFATLREELVLSGYNVSITVCTLGVIGTESAMKDLENFETIKNHMTFNSVTETADRVIRGGALRVKKVYYPYFDARILPVIHEVVPAFSSLLAQFLWAEE